MSEVLIDYSKLSSSIKALEKANDRLDDYSDVISKKVLATLSSISGSDDCGYISAAYSAAGAKKADISRKKAEFSNLRSGLSSLEETAKETDKRVRDRINDIAEDYLPGFWEKPFRSIGNFIYNTVCVEFGSFFSDTLGLDAFVEWSRKALVTVGDVKAKVQNFFKHGEGQYWLNIAGAVKDVFKVVVLVGSVAMLAVTVPWLMPLAFLGVCTGGVYLVKQFMDMEAAVTHNQEAIALYRKGDKALAHYYGSTEDIVDWAYKTDFGGEKANSNWESLIEVVDIFGDAAETFTKLVGVVASIGAISYSFSEVRSADGKTVIDRDFSKNYRNKQIAEWKKNNLEDLGIVKSDGKTSFNPLKFVVRNPAGPFKKLYKAASEGDSIKTLSGVLGVYSVGEGLLNGEGSISAKVEKVTEADTVAEAVSEGYDVVTDYTGIGSYVDEWTGEPKKVGEIWLDFWKASNSGSGISGNYTPSAVMDEINKIRDEGMDFNPALSGSW